MSVYWGVRKKLLVITAVTMLPLLVGAAWITTNLVEKIYSRQAYIVESATLSRVTSRLIFLARMASSDVLFISRLPSVTALALARRRGGDFRSGRDYKKNYDQSRKALIGFREAKKVYDQARLLDATGREVLRINLEGGRAREVPVPELQPKGKRYYFTFASRLPKGRVYVSHVDLNRERGRIEKPHKPVLRLVTPLRDATGKLTGVVALNFHARRLFRDSLAGTVGQGPGVMMILDREGYYLYHSRRTDRLWGSPRDLNTGHRCQKDFGSACRKMLGGGKTSVTWDGRTWDAYSRVVTFPDNPDKSLAVAHLLPPPTFLAYLSQFGWVMILASVLALVWLSGRMVVKPLIRLNETMKRFTDHDWAVRSDLNSRDEVGRLAAGFNDMAVRLQELYADLEAKVAERTAELEHTNRQLTQSEGRARAILDSTVDAIITIDSSGVVQSFNQGAEKIFGYSSAEVVGNNVKMLQPPEVAREHDQYIQRYLETGEAHIIGHGRQAWGRRKDGSKFPMYLAVSEVRLEDATLFTGIIRDVTELRATEESLRESRRIYQSLTEAAPVGIFYTDAQGSCTFVNDRWSRITGLSEEQALGDGWVQALHPEDKARVFEEFGRATEAGRPFSAEYRFQSPDGRLSWVYGQAVAEKDQDGTLKGFFGTITDITERILAEQDNLSLGRILEASINEIYIFALDTLKFRQVNQGARENLGYSMDELLEMTPVDIKPEFTAEKFEEVIVPLRDGRAQRLDFTTVHQRKDGSTYPVQVYLQVSDRELEPVFVAIIQDITDQQKARSEIERLSLAV
jgi:PAS domain S-box-containing protein